MVEPHNAELQRAVVTEALALTDRDDIPLIESIQSPGANG
jgi:hypothetical protein